jgi:DNA-binding Lrp family transcriptional regulator
MRREERNRNKQAEARRPKPEVTKSLQPKNLQADKMKKINNNFPLDETDKAILNRIQSDFPMTSRPYLAIAEELCLTEDVVVSRLKKLKKNGIIRRMGGNFVPEKLGFVSTLCAAVVPEEKIGSFTKVINRYSGVTHNYLRDGNFNVWFTFIAPSMKEIDSNLKQISKETGVKEIINLPATKVFKIKAHFDL